MKFKIVGIEQYSFIQAEQKKNTFTPPTTVQKRVTSNFSSEKVIVNHTRETFKAALVKMAVDSALSLRMFTTDGFKDLVGELAAKLQEMIQFFS